MQNIGDADFDKLQKEAERAFSRGDYQEAFRKFMLCAERGDAPAQYNLAILFAQGFGPGRDLETAEIWAEKAWDQGLENAKGLLGYILRKRSEEAGMRGDTAAEKDLLKRAAALGNKAAMVKQASLEDDYDTMAALRAEAKSSPLYPLANALIENALDSADSEKRLFEIENGVLIKYNGMDRSVLVPAGVKKIGDLAFEGRQDIERIFLPDGLTEIGRNAFSGSRAAAVRLPGSLRVIRDDAFQLCEALRFCGETNAEGFTDGPLESRLELPEGFCLLEESAFCGCVRLKSITVPGSLREIPDGAFCDCTALEHVRIKPGVTKISRNAFALCPNLTEVSIPESVTEIDDEAIFRPSAGSFPQENGWIAADSKDFPGMVKIDAAHYRPRRLVISGVPGSFAEQWAKRHEVPFKKPEALP